MATVAARQSRGTAAVLWETKTWTLVSEHDLGERLRAVVLKHAEGGDLLMLCGHMHHEARKREKQWVNLKPQLAAMPDIPRLFLMDCNSLIAPGADSLYANDVEPKMIWTARQTEVETLQQLQMVDAWTVIHSERDDPVPGYTFGFLGSNPQPRRIDRVYLSDTLVKHAIGAYNLVTGGADHNAVVLRIGNRDPLRAKPHFCMPTDLLKYVQAVEELSALVKTNTEQDPEGWWKKARAQITTYSTFGENRMPPTGDRTAIVD